MSANLQSPLKRAQGLGAAQAGTHHFIVQRITALALIPLMLWLVWLALTLLHADYAQARAVAHAPWNALLLLASVIAIFWHAQLGLQVVIEDYVTTPWLHLTAQLIVKFSCVLGALACALAIIRIASGS